MIIAKILLIILGSLLITAALYLKFGLFKKFYHNILGWHKPIDENDSRFDGCNVHNTCKYCGKEIIQDSQGNWF